MIEIIDEPTYDQRTQDIASAMAECEPGDHVVAHQSGCDGRKCSCVPDVFLCPRVEAQA